MKTISIANQKGGVGKTTTTAALGSVLSNHGYRVLMIDMDSQASLTKAFGVGTVGKSVADVLGGVNKGTLNIDEVVFSIRTGLNIAPSNILMYTSEMGLIGRMGRETVLKTALESLSGFDVILIDCPPSMGILTLNGLVASQGVIIPSLPSETDLQGVRSIIETLNGIEAAGLNSPINLLGVLIVQYDGRTNEHKRIVETIKSANHTLLGIIPRSVKVQESISANKPITEYMPKSKPALAYFDIAEKVIAWLEE